MLFLIEQTNAQDMANLREAGVVLLLGMCVVFLFLALLIYATKAMSAVLKKFAPAVPEKKAVAAPVAGAVPVAAGSNESEIAAAIAAAVVQSRK